MKSNSSTLRRIRAPMLAALVTAAAVIPLRAWALLKNDAPKYSNVCEYVLTPPNLQKRVEEARRVADEFNQRDYHYLGNHRGFSLTRSWNHSDDDAYPQLKSVYVPSLHGDYEPAIAQQVWESTGQEYEFVNVGLKTLETYSNRVNRTVFAQLLTHPEDDLVVYYDDERLWMGERLMKYRWAVHDAVLDIYRKKKPYLSENDFHTLIYLNRISQNSDVLALLYPKNMLPTRSVSKRVALTIQISYFGDRQYFRPSVAEIVDPEHMPSPKDLLPFEYRIPVDRLADFRARFYSRFPARYTCEMLRYASMDNKIPQSMRDRFLLIAFQKAVQRGMKYIIAGADKYTERLYRRYGFQIYSALPTGQNDEEEYILYLKVNSPEFREMLGRLQRSAKIDHHYKMWNFE